MSKARERESRAFELRKAGASYRQIGEDLGVTKQAAHKMVTRVLSQMLEKTSESVPAVRRMELERIDAMTLGMWEKARKGDGKAVDRVLRLMSRRAALLGLDVPVAVDLTTTPGAMSDSEVEERAIAILQSRQKSEAEEPDQ